MFQIGCETLEYEQITVGNYIYAFDENRGFYLIVELSEEGKQKEILVFPRKLNGKIARTGSWGGGYNKLYKRISSSITTDKLKKIMMQENIEQDYLIHDSYSHFNPTYQFRYIRYNGSNMINIKFKAIINTLNLNDAVSSHCFYYTSNGYLRESTIFIRKSLFTNKIFNYIDETKRICGENYDFDSQINFIRPANVEFHWNYENSPQEDYYWIDDIENGEFIEEIPPIPEREGYTFGGWYTEKECINEFSFSTPISKMDIDWEELYNSRQQVPDEYVTSLYAKWIEI